MHKIFFIGLTSLLICFVIISCEVTDITSNNYDDFKTNNKYYLINLCTDKIPKCNILKNNLREISNSLKATFNIDINIGVIDINKQPKIAEQWVWEGFPSIYYVNEIEGENEQYIGAKEKKNLLKYLKYKLVFDIEEVNSEKEILISMKKDKLDVATVFIGDNKRSPFDINTLARAAKVAGMNKVYLIKNEVVMKKFKVEEYDVGLYNSNSEVLKVLNLSEEDDDLNLKKISHILLINKRNSRGYFQNLRAIDLEYSLTKNVPTLFYIYGEKSQLTSGLENDITDLAKRYKNEFLFFKSSINNKPLKYLEIEKLFNITSADLPVLIITAESPHSDDDVEKFIVRASELRLEREKYVKLKKEKQGNEVDETKEASDVSDVSDLITKQTVENLLENYKKGKLFKSFYTEWNDVDIKMTGENFAGVIDESLDEGKEIVLLICPKISKKFERIRTRLMRVYEKLYESNEQKILFDEFDPFVNEISNVKYTYLPTFAHIKKNPDNFSPNKWIVNIKHNNFFNKDIIEFVKSNSKFEISVNNTVVPEFYEEEEIKNPLLPILKKRLDSKFLSEHLVDYNIGLKRRWYALKKHGLILSNEDLSQFEVSNEWEEDYEPDDYAKNDNFDEKSYEDKQEEKKEL